MCPRKHCSQSCQVYKSEHLWFYSEWKQTDFQKSWTHNDMKKTCIGHHWGLRGHQLITLGIVYKGKLWSIYPAILVGTICLFFFFLHWRRCLRQCITHNRYTINDYLKSEQHKEDRFCWFFCLFSVL